MPRIMVAVKASSEWRPGQYFIVDDYEENYVPGVPVRTGKNKYTIMPDGTILRPFSQIAAIVQEVGRL